MFIPSCPSVIMSNGWNCAMSNRYNMMFAYSVLGLPFLDVIRIECSVLCPIACEKFLAARVGFKPATPAF